MRRLKLYDWRRAAQSNQTSNDDLHKCLAPQLVEPKSECMHRHHEAEQAAEQAVDAGGKLGSGGLQIETWMRRVRCVAFPDVREGSTTGS